LVNFNSVEYALSFSNNKTNEKNQQKTNKLR